MKLKRLLDARERSHLATMLVLRTRGPRCVWRSDVARRHPVKALRLAIPAMRYSVARRHEFHLGTRVVYKGDEWYVSNGTCRPRWDIRKVADHSACERVREDDMVKVRSMSNWRNDAFDLYGWWVESWSSLDIRDALDGNPLASLRILGARSPLSESRWAR